MKSKLPVKKSKEEIAFYIENGPKFGNVLHTLYDGITNGKLHNGIEIENKFFSLVGGVDNKAWALDAMFPFSYEKNYLGHMFICGICVSVNDVIAHGRPTEEPFKKGDVVSVDCGLSLSFDHGRLHFDSAFTASFGTEPLDWILKPHEALVNIHKEQAKNTHRVAEIISSTANSFGLDTVVMLTGHGIGYSLHEKPTIRNAPGKYSNEHFFEGLCFCAEPIFVQQNMGNGLARAYVDSDGWSIKTINSQPGSHFETMFCIHNKKLIDICGITNWFC